MLEVKMHGVPHFPIDWQSDRSIVIGSLVQMIQETLKGVDAIYVCCFLMLHVKHAGRYPNHPS